MVFSLSAVSEGMRCPGLVFVIQPPKPKLVHLSADHDLQNGALA